MLPIPSLGSAKRDLEAGAFRNRSLVGRLLAPRPAKLAGQALFERAAARARSPALYREGGVPDTVEGRFECYALHVDLVLHRLKRQGPEAGEVGQAMFDKFLDNLDEGLREMGVGDLSVGKKMRKLGEAIYGRMKGYDAALDAVLSDPDDSNSGESTSGESTSSDLNLAPLAALIGRVLFNAEDAPQGAPLAAYAAACARALAAQPLGEVMAGELAWPPFGEPEPVVLDGAARP
jgi:cytochrome b pre-mRNA-processing protein 3